MNAYRKDKYKFSTIFIFQQLTIYLKVMEFWGLFSDLSLAAYKQKVTPSFCNAQLSY